MGLYIYEPLKQHYFPMFPPTTYACASLNAYLPPPCAQWGEGVSGSLTQQLTAKQGQAFTFFFFLQEST